MVESTAETTNEEIDMKKIGFVLFTVIAALSAINCGSSACDDYVAKVKSCSCDALTDATAKAACEKQADALSAAATAAGSDACQAALDALTATCK